MADSLCGPSNALSKFQKHTSVDRTLQQDRLASHKAREQGFRSAPGPNAGILDAEFEAFQQAGQLPPQLYDEHPQHLTSAHGVAGQAFPPPQPQLSGWASDFQNMSLNEFPSSSAPLPNSLQFASPSPQPSASAAWHQEFMRQPGFDLLEQQTRISQSPVMQDPNYQPWAPMSSGLIGPQFPSQQEAYNQTQNQDHLDFQETNDDALFERHFAAAAKELDQTMGQAEAEIQPLSGEKMDFAPPIEAFDNASLLGPSIQRDGLHSEAHLVDADVYDPIGSDRIPKDDSKGKRKETENTAIEDGDELARTAGVLLENVKHDQTQKFQQSNFLNLMRQLRDREVRVEGDKLVDATQPLHPGGDFYPT